MIVQLSFDDDARFIEWRGEQPSFTVRYWPKRSAKRIARQEHRRDELLVRSVEAMRHFYVGRGADLNRCDSSSEDSLWVGSSVSVRSESRPRHRLTRFPPEVSVRVLETPSRLCLKSNVSLHHRAALRVGILFLLIEKKWLIRAWGVERQLR